MNIEKLKKLQEKVRIGGTGTCRRKKKALHKHCMTDDKKIQSALKQIGVNAVQGIQQVNMIKRDGTTMSFTNPKVEACLSANTFSVLGYHTIKPSKTANESDKKIEDDSIPELVGNFDEASKND